MMTKKDYTRAAKKEGVVKRASYRDAVDFIAWNDEPGIGADAKTIEIVAELVTVTLVASIFAVELTKVAKDVIKLRLEKGI